MVKLHKNRQKKLAQKRRNRSVADPYSDAVPIDPEQTEAISETASQPESGVWSQNGHSDKGENGAVWNRPNNGAYPGNSVARPPQAYVDSRTFTNHAYQVDEEGPPPKYNNVTPHPPVGGSTGSESTAVKSESHGGARPRAPPRASKAYQNYIAGGEGRVAHQRTADTETSVSAPVEVYKPPPSMYAATEHLDIPPPAAHLNTISGSVNNEPPSSVRSEQKMGLHGDYLPEPRGAYTDIPHEKQNGLSGNTGAQRPRHAEPRRLDFVSGHGAMEGGNSGAAYIDSHDTVI